MELYVKKKVHHESLGSVWLCFFKKIFLTKSLKHVFKELSPPSFLKKKKEFINKSNPPIFNKLSVFLNTRELNYFF